MVCNKYQTKAIKANLIEYNVVIQWEKKRSFTTFFSITVSNPYKNIQFKEEKKKLKLK